MTELALPEAVASGCAVYPQNSLRKSFGGTALGMVKRILCLLLLGITSGPESRQEHSERPVPRWGRGMGRIAAESKAQWREAGAEEGSEAMRNSVEAGVGGS